MALTVTTTHVPMGAVTVHRIVNNILSVKESIVSWNEARLTRKQLLNLSDDQLHDIGLTRSDLR